jgi:hypothetical protein
MTDKMTPEEIVARALTNHFDHPYGMLHDYVAVDILNELKYHEMVALILEKDKEIENLNSDLELFMDLCDKKDEWLEVQRNEIAELKRDNKYFRKELSFRKGSVTGDDHDYEYESLE